MKGIDRILPIAAAIALLSASDSANASCPSERAAKLETRPDRVSSHPDSTGPEVLQWYQYFGEQELGGSAVVRFDFALATFENGHTLVGLDEIDGRTIVSLLFEDGELFGSTLTYREGGWNDVSVIVDYASQSYTVAINGSAPASYPLLSQTNDPSWTSTSLQAFRVHNNHKGSKRDVAWIDEISIAVAGGDVLFEEDFDEEGPSYHATPGVLSIETPPDRVTPPAGCIRVESLAAIAGAIDEISSRNGLAEEDAQSLATRIASAARHVAAGDRPAAVAELRMLKNDLAGLESAKKIAPSDALSLRVHVDAAIKALTEAPSAVESTSVAPRWLDLR